MPVQAALFGDGIDRAAWIEGPYRYALSRTWAPARGSVLWVLFNPSTGDGRQDDPTLRRCLGFTESWGFGGFEVVNLYALRSPEPWRVFDVEDPVGPKNDQAVTEALARATSVVVGWGATIGPRHLVRVAKVESLADRAGINLECLGQTFNGHPRHPLYLKADTPRVPYRRVA